MASCPFCNSDDVGRLTDKNLELTEFCFCYDCETWFSLEDVRKAAVDGVDIEDLTERFGGGEVE